MGVYYQVFKGLHWSSKGLFTDSLPFPMSFFLHITSHVTLALFLLLGAASYCAACALRQSTDVVSAGPRRSSHEIPSALGSSHPLRVHIGRIQFFYDSKRLIFEAYRKVHFFGI